MGWSNGWSWWWSSSNSRSWWPVLSSPSSRRTTTAPSRTAARKTSSPNEAPAAFLDNAASKVSDQPSDPAARRPRVLVEHADYAFAFAAENILERNGYDVDVCRGPDHIPGGRCPFVRNARCDLVDRADVVFHGLNPDRAKDRAVLGALQGERPELPVVVELTPASARRDATVLEGCITVPFRMTSAEFEDALRAALAAK
jgi:hypothetical protein